MNAKFTRILSWIGLLLLCACVETEAPVRNHEGEKAHRFQSALPQGDGQAVAGPDVWVDPKDSASGRVQGRTLDEWKAALAASKSPFAEVLLPLARELWAPGVLQEPRIYGTEFFRSSLRFLHAEILDHLKHSEARDELLPLLRAGLGGDCLERLEGCASLPALQADTGSSQVLARLVLQAGDDLSPAERMGFTLIAIDLMKSRPAFAELEELAFRESVLLDSVNSRRDFADQQRVLAWNHLLSNSLASYAAETRVQSIPDYIRDYLVQADWSQALRSRSPGLLTDQKTILRLARRASLLDEGIGRELASWREQSELITGLRALEPSPLYRNLELPGLRQIQASTQLFILDGVYSRRISPDAGAELLLHEEVTPQDYQKALAQFIQLRFALMIGKTSEFMADELKRNDITTKIFYDDVIRRSKTIALQWEAFVRDAGELRRLGLTYLDLTPHAQDRTQVRIEIESLITSLPANIKQMAVYPNMLMMIYYLAHSNFNITIRTYFGLFNISAENILSSLMTGSLYPFFQFGTDGQAMGFIDVLYSVVYAFKTDTFNTFDIDRIEFLKTISEKYLEKDSGILRDDYKKIRSHFEGHGAGYRRFQRTCATLALRDCEENPDFHPICSNQRILSQAQERLPDLWMKAEDLRSRVFHGIPGSRMSVTGGKEIAPIGISPDFIGASMFYLLPGKNTDFSQNLSSTLEVARLDLREKLRTLQLIIDLSVKHLNDRGESTEASRLAQTMSEFLQPYQDLLNDLISEVLERELEIGDCYTYLPLKEQEAREQVYQAEEKHLRFVHRQMKRARAGDGSLQDLNAPLFRDSRTFEKLKGFDWYRAFALSPQTGAPNPATVGFTENYYHLSTVQFLARVARYLEEGADYIDVEALAPFTTVEFPTEIQNLGRNLQHKRIEWTESEDEFVRRGFESIFGSHWPFAEWLKITGTSYNFPFRTLTRARLLASIYKFGDIQGVRDQGMAQTDACESESCYRLSPESLIDSVLRLYELMSINDRDEKWLRLAGLQGKAGSQVDLRNIAYKYTDSGETSEYNGTLAPLDFLFELVNAVSIDKTYVPGVGIYIVEQTAEQERKRVPIPFAADFFFSHCYSMIHTLYPVINDFQDELERYFRAEVQKDWLRRQEVVEASERRYREDLAKGKALTHFHFFVEGELESPYLSSHNPSNFRAQWVEFFDQKTQGFYSPGQSELLCRELRHR